MIFIGRRSRKLYSISDCDLVYSRDYFYCDKCRIGVHPDDEAEGVNEIGIAPRLQEVMSLFGMQAPYNKPPQIGQAIMERVLHVKDLSRQTQRVAILHGGRLREMRDGELAVEVEREREDIPPAMRSGRLVAQMDGAMVRSDGRWREVKNGMVYWDDDRIKKGERGEILRKEYVSTLAGGIERFREQFDGAMLKMGVMGAEEVIFIGDGAEWIWRFKADYYPEAIEILDWYHAKDYLVRLADALWPVENRRRNEWLAKQKSLLWDGDVVTLLRNLKRLSPKSAHQKERLKTTISYYEKNRKRMQYDEFREKGYTIGSGAVESSHKYLIQARMKLAGMRWKENGAEAIINLRNFWYNNRWDEMWTEKFSKAS
jgi:hypothetical protein